MTDGTAGTPAPQPAPVAIAAPVATVEQASTSSGDIFSTLGIEKPSYPEFLYTSIKDPWPEDTVAACNAFDTRWPKQRACICDNCMELIHECDALPGCKEILTCAVTLGCTDSASCYYAPANGTGCQTQIDEWGTGSVSTALIVLIASCRTDNNCPSTAE
jgi:hypothetical protein